MQEEAIHQIWFKLQLIFKNMVPRELQYIPDLTKDISGIRMHLI